ncbi:TcaA NTF2-like domain-containing protein [Bacillus piscicola]|uniref:TcaA NTF2-like domain-containing protein n=1 Tax=Bacillus piscicola TaxID=1632684 RepID=UPI001F098144|nr:DUF5050 domain-containing protein [Bacillus piscicola]
MKWGKGVIFIFLLLLAAAGCSNDEETQAGTKKSPAAGHTSFLLFESEYESDYGSAGNLYITGKNAEPSRIASDVLDHEFTYYNEDEKVLYVTENRDLYEFTEEAGSVKLGESVSSYQRTGVDTVTFVDEQMDLYMVKNGEDAEKVASSVFQYELAGDHLYYTDDDGDFRLYNVSTREEKKLSSDAFVFELLSDKEDIAYVNGENALYYVENADAESVRISSDPVRPDSAVKMNGKLYYVGFAEEDKPALYVADLAENTRPVKIIDGVQQYDYYNDQFYYTTEDGTFYRKEEDADKAVRMTSEVARFEITKDAIFLMDEDDSLYKWTEKEEKQKVGSDVMDFSITGDNKVLYNNTNHELFLNKTKLETELDNYVYSYGNTAYATTKDELYIMENMKEAERIDIDLKKYSAVFYQNERVYSNLMDADDIVGVWKAEYEGDSTFLQFHKDGVVEHLENGEKVNFDVTGETYESLGLTVDGEYSTLRRVEGGLSLDTNGQVIMLTKSTAEEAAEYYADEQLRADKLAVEAVMSQYIESFASAVNYGEMYYISDFIDPASPLYDQQAAFIADMYAKNTKEELVNYTITEIKSAKESGYHVRVEEIFTIYSTETGTETKKQYNNVYHVKQIDGQFYITDLQVNQDVIEENTI